MSYTMIGITGPSGAGKGVVTEIFSQFGFAIIDADKLARDIMKIGSPTLKKAADAFGKDILNSDGSLDRQRLADIAFADKNKTKLLNGITHPAILDKARALADSYANMGYRFVIFDAPLLFESGADRLCDSIIAVIAPYDVRIDRIMRRDGITKEQAEIRISAQHGDKFYMEKSDFCINNDDGIENIKSQVKYIIDTLRKL